MTKKQRLELNWIGKNQCNKLEPRILIEKQTIGSSKKSQDNLLIHGDNLLALKALETDYTGKIKCIYIDPPFNTGQAFDDYSDGLEHSIWLSLMRDRLMILRNLLREDGVIFIQIDYRESARLKLLMDEIFGIACFKNEIIVKRGTKNVQSQFETIDSLASGHDTIYLYSKSSNTRLKKLMALEDDLTPGKWDTFWRGTDRPTMRYELLGEKIKEGQWRWREERAITAVKNYSKYLKLYSKKMTLDEYFSNEKQSSGKELDFLRKNENNVVQYYVPPRNYKIISDIWMDIPTLGKITDFSHEKHEALLERVIRWSTEEGDYVLDSFAGSGTTGAVAYKLNRKWIMIEQGNHIFEYTLPRMQAVYKDKKNENKFTGTKGKKETGFKLMSLAKSLLEKDFRGNWIISSDYDSNMLAEAVCKHEGFRFAPDSQKYWKQGHSTKKDFIFVTTQFLTTQHVDHIVSQMKNDETLLICAKTFRFNAKKYKNITVKKIPQMLLGRCEFDRDDYSLNIFEGRELNIAG